MAIDFVKLRQKIPNFPGVYLMQDRQARILYVGKAGDLRRRVASYFERPQDARIARMLTKVAKIDFQKTATVIEALILEAELIKRYSPQYNIKDKDDRSFLYVIITREKFPRVVVMRTKEAMAFGNPLGYFGPFTSPTSLRAAMKILRRIFPWAMHGTHNMEHGTKRAIKPCFDYQIGLCPGTCVGGITSVDYKKNIKQLILFFRGQKKRVMRELVRDMRAAVKETRFEAAAAIRNKLHALSHIQDVALLDKPTMGDSISHGWGRVEGYDISNISGTSAVGAMVVFKNGEPAPGEYRKFKIKTIKGVNDVGMMTEVLRRRLAHREWELPGVILVDGGVGQVNAARSVLSTLKLGIPVIGIAKGKERKRNDFLYPLGMHEAIFKSRDMLVRVRDEAHRFAVKYHRELRGKL